MYARKLMNRRIFFTVIAYIEYTYTYLTSGVARNLILGVQLDIFGQIGP
jgi:hypothetical protein